ncbi:uncharacterized protein BJ212DRAFT_1271479, partial [Suillus subaureus]
AGLGLRVSVASMVGTMHLNIANFLCSSDVLGYSLQRDLIIRYIVLTIACMHLVYPLSMALMFPLALIQRFVVSKSVDCTDLSASDRFFDTIIQNSFVPLARNAHVWRPCIVPVPDKSNRVPVQSLNHNIFYSSSHAYSPPLSDVEEDETEHIVIKTSYDPLALGNKSFKAPRNKAANDIWSADERLRAEQGERIRSIDGLRAKLANLYHNGVKRSPDTYLRIPMEIIPNHHLDLHCKDGLLMAFVSMALLNHIHSVLEVNLLSALERPELLEEVDTQLPGCQHFQVMHLSWYNRHCTSGNEAPKEVQLWLLEKEGMRTNHQQVIPYISKDLHEHQCIYSTISHVYAELFEWVRKLMENFLQDKFEMLMEVASILLGNHCPPFVPFISLVININVRTKAHCDGQDCHFCLVIPIGHFQGGAFCASGDVALFRSSEVTHFNLDYKGARASLVFQTDREFATWLKNQNGWVDNQTMHSFV